MLATRPPDASWLTVTSAPRRPISSARFSPKAMVILLHGFWLMTMGPNGRDRDTLPNPLPFTPPQPSSNSTRPTVRRRPDEGSALAVPRRPGTGDVPEPDPAKRRAGSAALRSKSRSALSGTTSALDVGLAERPHDAGGPGWRRRIRRGRTGASQPAFVESGGAGAGSRRRRPADSRSLA